MYAVETIPNGRDHVPTVGGALDRVVDAAQGVVGAQIELARLELEVRAEQLLRGTALLLAGAVLVLVAWVALTLAAASWLIKDLSESLPSRESLLHSLGLEYQRSASATTTAGLTGFTLGLVVGAAVTLLYAPRPGREVREDLGRRARRIKESVAQETGSSA